MLISVEIVWLNVSFCSDVSERIITQTLKNYKTLVYILWGYYVFHSYIEGQSNYRPQTIDKPS